MSSIEETKKPGCDFALVSEFTCSVVSLALQTIHHCGVKAEAGRKPKHGSLSADGKYNGVVWSNGEVTIHWSGDQVSEAIKLGEVSKDSEATSIAWHPTRKYTIAVGFKSGKVNLYYLKSTTFDKSGLTVDYFTRSSPAQPHPVIDLGEQEPIEILQFTSDGKLVTVSPGDRFKVWDTSNMLEQTEEEEEKPAKRKAAKDAPATQKKSKQEK